MTWVLRVSRRDSSIHSIYFVRVQAIFVFGVCGASRQPRGIRLSSTKAVRDHVLSLLCSNLIIVLAILCSQSEFRKMPGTSYFGYRVRTPQAAGLAPHPKVIIDESGSCDFPTSQSSECVNISRGAWCGT